jgi:hypothetical protein
MPADVRIQVKPPAVAEPRHPSRRKATAAEAEVLAHYPAKYRRELLRRWRRADEIPDDVVAREIRALEQRVEDLLATSRLLLALKLIERGHAKNLRAASRLAKDLDRVRELEPTWFS